MDGVSLYLHIPFCRKKCDYCDFFSVGQEGCADSASSKADYVQALIREVHFYARYYAVSRWNTIYIGGGTPSQLSCEQIRMLMRGILSAAPAAPHAEITIEVNPDDVTVALLQACAEVGIQRISMGIQAFDTKVLSAVSRKASAEAALRALDLLQTYWTGRLSCDLIAGLPGHTYRSFEQGIQTLLSFPRVEHISLYTLTVEPGTPLEKRIAANAVRWSPEKADAMWLRGRNVLEKADFVQYEVSNFAKKHAESQHNMAYWTLQDYIGCGAGATGSLYTPGFRWTNGKSVSAYNAFWNALAPDAAVQEIAAALLQNPALRSVEQLDAETQMFEFLMLGFRMCDGVRASVFKERFGKNIGERIGAEDGVFAQWKKQGLATETVSPSDIQYALSRRGILLLNRFLELLL